MPLGSGLAVAGSRLGQPSVQFANPPRGRSLLARRDSRPPGVVIAAPNLYVPAVPLERDPIPVLASRRDVIRLSRRTQRAVKPRPSPATPRDESFSALRARSLEALVRLGAGEIMVGMRQTPLWRALTAAACLVVAVALAACGGGDSSPAASGPEASAPWDANTWAAGFCTLFMDWGGGAGAAVS